jgi:hypothetical protein
VTSRAQPAESWARSTASGEGENTSLWSHARPTPAAPLSLPASAASTRAEAEPETTPTTAPDISDRRTPLRARWVALAFALLLAVAVIAMVALSSGGSAPRGENFASAARPVPENRVSGSGRATVELHGNRATVTLVTDGLLNGSPHLSHIHAGGQGVCPPASAARRHNGHLSISTTDGLKYYGPPVVSLTTTGDTGASSNIDFPRYPTSGTIRYERTMTVTSAAASAIRAGNSVIVVHGIDYNGNGIYDDVLDRSELIHALPGEATAPALCGPLANSRSVAHASRHYSATVRYTASLGTL